jgi:hypothetical protein
LGLAAGPTARVSERPSFWRGGGQETWGDDNSFLNVIDITFSAI